MIKNFYSFRKLGKPYGLTYSKMAGVGLCSLLLCASPQIALADVATADAIEVVQQSTKIKGVIKDGTGYGVIGAAVVVKGTTNGVVTDFDGNFELNAKVGDVLEISYVGYKTVTIKATAQPMSITLQEDTELLDEVVVVGYGTTSKRKTTSAVAVVKADDIAAVQVSNITQSLAGRAPGLIVQQSGGGLDQRASISIRGGGTPLYVIDGVICETRDFENLNSNDIESMSVLKDASATAVYGARAANGIIMVTTKRGETGKMNVDYSFNYSLSGPANMPEKLGSYDVAYYINQSRLNDGMAAVYSDEDLELFRNGKDPEGHPNTDWQELMMKDYAPEMRHNLSISGGTENIKVYTALGYYNQESLYRTDTHDVQRYNFRSNVETNFKEIGLKMTTGIDAYILDKQNPNVNGAGGYYYVFSHIQNTSPTKVAYNPFGQIYNGTPDNPLLDIAEGGGYNKSSETSVRGNLNLEWALPWVKGLTLKATGSYGITNDRYKNWSAKADTYDWEGNKAAASKPSLSKSSNYHNQYNLQFFADYSNTFAEVHTVGATFGVEASGSDYDNMSVSRNNYILNIDQINSGPVASAQNSSSEGTSFRRAAFIGRVKYDYAAKYMVEANVRHDGSDYFPSDKRWGTFFSGSLAWAASEENFWKNWGIDKVFEQFKVRTSYGEIGQDDADNLGRYRYLSSYNYNPKGVYLGGAWNHTFSEGNLVCNDITWYTTKDFNVGVDFASLNSRLSGSIDYFAKITTGYLASPSNVGYTAPLGKSLPKVKTDGEYIRQGFEFILQWKDRIGDLSYGASANFTVYDGKYNINPYESETDLKNPYKRSTQESSYTANYYKSLGYFKDYLDVMNSPWRTSSSNVMAGDIKYYDFNGDGKLDGEDQHRLGAGRAPKANYGINVDLGYKGWNFNMLWQGATNYNVYLGSNLINGADVGYDVLQYDFQTDYWTPDNTDAPFPRLHSSSSFNGGQNTRGTDFWMVDMKYIRLKNISIGYDFKHKLLKKVAWMSKCNLSLSGYNLLTFSPAMDYGYDPEFGVESGYGYPVNKTYTISLNIGF